MYVPKKLVFDVCMGFFWYWTGDAGQAKCQILSQSISSGSITSCSINSNESSSNKWEILMLPVDKLSIQIKILTENQDASLIFTAIKFFNNQKTLNYYI